MKIVRVIARLNVGGPARHVAWLTAATRKAGIESLLVAGSVPPGEDDMTYFALEQGITPVIIPEMSREISPKDVLAVGKLLRLFLHERPDIVHTHTAKAGTVGRIAGWLYRWLTPSALWNHPRQCRFVHTYHGHIFHSYYGPLKTKFFLTIERILAHMTDRIVVISQRQYEEIQGEFRVGRRDQFALIPEGQFAIIPLGLDTTVFANWEQRRHAARESLGIADTDLAVGIVGRLTAIKNHKMFLDVAARYQQLFHSGGSINQREARFIVIGDGELRRELEQHAATLGLQDAVSFTGLRDDPESFYAAMDVVALTSLNEGTPLTLIEAMANARPVIATAVGGVVDLLGDCARPSESSTKASYVVCERGVLAVSNDAEGFCQGLKFLLEQEERRREMGERGRAFVEQNYSKERLVADMLALYEQLHPAKLESQN
ncbi:MAG TPA: glycosyltransferase [Pyrinomonadaceae bacterium]|nr:glycosyltransferase [Pyrinomonadaceae bacterium]